MLAGPELMLAIAHTAYGTIPPSKLSPIIVWHSEYFVNAFDSSEEGRGGGEKREWCIRCFALFVSYHRNSRYYPIRFITTKRAIAHQQKSHAVRSTYEMHELGYMIQLCITKSSKSSSRFHDFDFFL